LICSEVAASFAHFSSAKERRIIQRSNYGKRDCALRNFPASGTFI
jgi:hypothetical protein